jgi:hypothetical protein
MRYPLPSSNVNPSHQDHPALRDISEEILRLGGGQGALVREIGLLLRQCIDEVLKTPKTGRYRYEELERVEKTYIGQLVEIEIRSLLQLQKGKLLDVVILNREVDIKHTMGNNWMIPPEAVDRVCLLVAADEERLRCYFGAFVARPEYLTSAGNRDKKRTISASGFENIF